MKDAGSIFFYPAADTSELEVTAVSATETRVLSTHAGTCHDQPTNRCQLGEVTCTEPGRTTIDQRKRAFRVTYKGRSFYEMVWEATSTGSSHYRVTGFTGDSWFNSICP